VPAIRTLAVVLTAWVLVLLAPAGPASAGGPTSVLLSVPGEGRTASLYYTEDTYEELAELVGAYGSAGTVDSSGRSHESGTGVTLTWLIHDVSPWRVDRVYLQGNGAPWIASQVMEADAETVWDSPIVWHQPTNGEELTQLLNSLGVGRTGGAEEPVVADEPEAAAPAPVEPPSAAPTTPAADPSGTSSGNRVGWGLGGLAGGLLLAVGWTRLRSRRRRSPDVSDPDGQLDAEPGREWLSVGR